MEIINYEEIFQKLVKGLENYCKENKIKSLVLGISGGIDSTVVAAIAREVCNRLDIPLIGRSLPIKNKDDEFDTSKLVGKSFCDSFEIVPMEDVYQSFLYFTEEAGLDLLGIIGSNQSAIQEGNIQARLRMIYLYNLAGITGGLVLSTDNQTEYQLGFWTIHGDVGDYDPIQALWKTEVYGLANYILDYLDIYRNPLANDATGSTWCENAYQALRKSIALTPTDGLGISNSDLEQIGAKSYADVEDILKNLMNKYPYGIYAGFNESYELLTKKYGKFVVDCVWKRHLRSEFKRKKLPISIERAELWRD